MPVLIKIAGQTIDADASLLAHSRHVSEQSLYEFHKRAWRWIDPAPWVDSWAIGAVAEHLQAVCDGEIKRLIINIPPRTGKSKLVSVSFPAWIWAQQHRSFTSGPGVKFLCASHGIDLAFDLSTECRRLIGSEWYQRRWGDRYRVMSDKDNKTQFDNSEHGFRRAMSVDMRTTGFGGDIILADDPNDAKQAMSEAHLASVISWWTGTMSTRLNNQSEGARIVIQQRLGEEDLTGYILSRNLSDWTHLMLPMRFEPERSFITAIGWEDPREEPGELLWPERFDEAGVNNLIAEMDSPWLVAGQLQQRPEPKGGGVIKRDWWLLWEADAFPPMDYIIASLDTAHTEKQENDYSAMTVWGVFSGDIVAQPTRMVGREDVVEIGERTYAETAPKVMLMTAWQERLALHDLVKKVADTCKRMRVDKLLIEATAAGYPVSTEIARLYGNADFMVQLVNPGRQDKLARLYSVQHLFAEGMVHAPNRLWADQVITQVSVFPRAKHDDLVDTTSMALRYLRDIGLLTRSEERIAEIEDGMKHTGAPLAPLYPG